MAIENELKFILRPDFDAKALKKWTQIDIPRQGYLSDSVRIREYDGHYIFTYKHIVQGEQIEIETPITQSDFDKLYPECVRYITKNRFQKLVQDEEWVVDFLKDKSGNIYFVMAECEMPEGRNKPLTMPHEIKKHILFSVLREDDRFTNKKLADQDYAKTMLNTLIKTE